MVKARTKQASTSLDDLRKEVDKLSRSHTSCVANLSTETYMLDARLRALENFMKKFELALTGTREAAGVGKPKAKRKGWVLIYPYGCGHNIYATEMDARVALGGESHGKVVPIEWEE